MYFSRWSSTLAMITSNMLLTHVKELSALWSSLCISSTTLLLATESLLRHSVALKDKISDILLVAMEKGTIV